MSNHLIPSPPSSFSGGAGPSIGVHPSQSPSSGAMKKVPGTSSSPQPSTSTSSSKNASSQKANRAIPSASQRSKTSNASRPSSQTKENESINSSQTSKAESKSAINRLGESTARTLCAGQVIIGTVSVVKELLENALDAGATSIDIRMELGGLKSISVKDNGSGIPLDDRPLVCQRYCTSKLASFNGLGNLSTYGFRGEALNSLCAAGQVSITTARADENVGEVLSFDVAGELTERSPIHTTTGTLVVVRSLFANIPVRRKHIQASLSKETKKITDLVTAYALVHPQVRFLLKNPPRADFTKTPLDSVGLGVAAVFGPKLLSHLAEVNYTSGSEKDSQELDVFGYLPAPGAPASEVSRAANDRVFIYINQRPVDSSTIFRAVTTAWRAAASRAQPSIDVSRRYPFTMLNFALPPSAFDVNVTPDKRTVFLHYEDVLIDAVVAIMEDLYKQVEPPQPPPPNPAPQMQNKAPLKTTPKKPSLAQSSASSSASSASSSAYGGAAKTTPKKRNLDQASLKTNMAPLAPAPKVQASAIRNDPPPAKRPKTSAPSGTINSEKEKNRVSNLLKGWLSQSSGDGDDEPIFKLEPRPSVTTRPTSIPPPQAPMPPAPSSAPAPPPVAVAPTPVAPVPGAPHVATRAPASNPVAHSGPPPLEDMVLTVDDDFVSNRHQVGQSMLTPMLQGRPPVSTHPHEGSTNSIKPSPEDIPWNGAVPRCMTDAHIISDLPHGLTLVTCGKSVWATKAKTLEEVAVFNRLVESHTFPTTRLSLPVSLTTVLPPASYRIVSATYARYAEVYARNGFELAMLSTATTLPISTSSGQTPMGAHTDILHLLGMASQWEMQDLVDLVNVIVGLEASGKTSSGNHGSVFAPRIRDWFVSEAKRLAEGSAIASTSTRTPSSMLSLIHRQAMASTTSCPHETPLMHHLVDLPF